MTAFSGRAVGGEAVEPSVDASLPSHALAADDTMLKVYSTRIALRSA
jgi:hypothetical protein